MTADALFDLEAELAGTRRVLDRVPDDRLGFRPHPKSWALGELATHVANVPGWIHAILTESGLDLAALPPPSALPTAAAIVERFDANAARVREAVAAADAAALDAPWAVRHGARVLSERPRRERLRVDGVSHLVHHRGQLTVYLRLLDVPVPGLYGPSADER